MVRRARLPLLSLGCVVLLATFAEALASWGRRDAGLGLTALARHFVVEGRRAQRLEMFSRATLRCTDGKVWVVENLAVGRLGLEEAVDLFGRLEDERDGVTGRPLAARGPERDARLRETVERFLRIHEAQEKARRTTPRAGKGNNSQTEQSG